MEWNDEHPWRPNTHYRVAVSNPYITAPLIFVWLALVSNERIFSRPSRSFLMCKFSAVTTDPSTEDSCSISFLSASVNACHASSASVIVGSCGSLFFFFSFFHNSWNIDISTAFSSFLPAQVSSFHLFLIFHQLFFSFFLFVNRLL